MPTGVKLSHRKKKKAPTMGHSMPAHSTQLTSTAYHLLSFYPYFIFMPKCPHSSTDSSRSVPGFSSLP